jgi:hypothetical protein
MLSHINEMSRALVSFSFSGVDDDVSAQFEPGVPPPSRRLEVIEEFSNAGIPCGMFLMPVLPFITDSPEQIGESITRGIDHGVKFVIFGGLTLKDGRQKDFFFRSLHDSHPGLAVEYDIVYPGSQWGAAADTYSQSLHEVFAEEIARHQIPPRIPRTLFQDILDENDYVSVLLDQLDYLLKLKNRTTPFGYASYQISKLDEPVSKLRDDGRLRRLKGVGPTTERVIKEILDTGTCRLYEENVQL